MYRAALLRTAHLLLPPIAYYVVALTGLFGREQPQSMHEAMYWSVPNYIWLTLPHMIWLFRSYMPKTSELVAHAGFVGAQFALLLMYALIYFSRPGGGSAWFVYYPLAIVCISVSAYIGRHLERRDEPKAA